MSPVYKSFNKIEKVVMTQALRLSTPVRQQAFDLMDKAKRIDMRAAQEILEATVIDGRVLSVDYSKEGEPVGMQFMPEQEKVIDHDQELSDKVEQG